MRLLEDLETLLKKLLGLSLVSFEIGLELSDQVFERFAGRILVDFLFDFGKLHSFFLLAIEIDALYQAKVEQTTILP